MPAISVGSVEVDVVPNTRGIYARLRDGVTEPANQVGDEIGRIMGRRTAAGIAQGVVTGMNRGGSQAQAAATRQGSQTGSAFARGFKTRLQAALADLPEVRLHANSTDADREIAAIRTQLRTLQDTRIGIDVSEEDAVAAMDRIRERLARLSDSDANVQVRVDTAAAAAQLAAFQAEVDRLDGQTVDVDTSASVSGMQALVTVALAFGPTLIPVLPVVAAGLGAIAAAGVAAAAGVGGIALVAVPAFKQIGSVLQAQKAAQDAATQATLRGGQASSQGASRALQMASAQQSLATAQRNAARQIMDAERGVTDAQRQAAQANAQAAQQVKSARQSAADAYEQASERMQQANSQVASAEKDLAAAQKSAKQAQADLTQARKDAAAQLEDLNNQLTDSVLSQRDAEIQLKEATAQRNAVLNNANASDLDKQKALLAYDEAVQRLNEQIVATQRLKKETTAANKAGVDGSKTVKDAQDQLAQAQQAVTDKTEALKTAQANVTKTQIQNTRTIADAQQKLAQAQANVAEAQRAGAEDITRAQERVVQAQQSGVDSITSAQRQIASAAQSAAGGVDQAAIAQAKYRAELAKLSPSARNTYKAFIDLRTAFSAWSKSLQPSVMPIFTRALVGLRDLLPTLTPFVTAAADAVTDLQDRFSRQVKTPFWRDLKKDLQASVKPAIIGLGITFDNVITGMAGAVDAFLPHMDGITGGLTRSTAKFADWGKSLKGSPEFERFLSFASEKGPLLARVLGDIAGAMLSIGVALAPFSGPLLTLLGGLANAIDIIATHAPWMVQGIWLAVVATRAWTIAAGLFNLVMNQNPIVRIVLLIVALVAAVIYAYNHWGWFRTAVQAAWAGIQAAALWAWNNVLKPTFNAIWTALQTVGRWAMWLWRNAISPAFHYISIAARLLATVVVVAVILPIVVAFKLLGAIAGWLWKNAIRPAFNAIVTGARWLYTNGIKPQFDLAVAAFRAAGKAGTWLWKNAIKPAFDGIGKAASWLYRNAIKPAWDSIVSAGKLAYEHGIKPIFDSWKHILRGLGSAFSSAVDAIESAWSKVKSVSRKPVQYVVDVVYNNGIRGVWNKVASAFGAPKLPVYKFATGGIMPGYTPGRDVHKFYSPTGGGLELSGGEAFFRPEFTRGVGSKFVGVMNWIAKTRGAQGVRSAMAPILGGNPATPTEQRFANGGIFGWIGSAASKVAGAGSTVWNTAKKGASWLSDTLEASARAGVKNVVNPLLNNFPGMDTSFGQMIRRIPTHIIDALFGYSKKADGKGGSAGGTSLGGTVPKGKRLLIINQALNAAHVPPPGSLAQWQTGLNTLITRESGWNPRAINRWDSNAKAGHPSQGLAQTIPGTFNAYVPKALKSRGILDPVANVAAAVRYIVARYGNITHVQQANAHMAPAGYDIGGWMPPGMNLMYNGLGQPEAVLTPTQWNAIHGAATRGSDGASTPTRFEGDLYLDSGEFLGKVRGEAKAVVAADRQQLITALNAS